MAKGKDIITFGLVLLCLTASSLVNVQPVKAQSLTNITINADGTVTPSSAPLQKTGDIYTLASNISGSVTIVESDIVLNGNAHAVYVPLALASTGSVIALDDVSNVTVTNLTVTGGQFGISVEGTSNLIEDNNVTECGTIYVWNGADSGGIYVNGGNSNNISNNVLEKNQNGLGFVDTSNNLIVGNTVLGGPNYYHMYGEGIYFEDASNNTIYHNNFENNLGSQAQSYNSTNHWDNGYPSGGNYWGYQTGKEIGGTGISDTPYAIDSQNKDRYPLTQPFLSSFLVNYALEVTPPKVSIMSPLKETYSKTNIFLSFSIDKLFNWVGYSLDGESNITINGNTTISNIGYGSHSITVYANSTFGINGASKTIDFNIAKSEPLSSEFVIAVLVTVIVIVLGVSLTVLYDRRHRKNR
ncbi:MAG: right-handed parallel beta-helix repeat-containing protein [Candidatus Bathyarchaeia archaeon]